LLDHGVAPLEERYLKGLEQRAWTIHAVELTRPRAEFGGLGAERDAQSRSAERLLEPGRNHENDRKICAV
jgi:hypothetical protein